MSIQTSILAQYACSPDYSKPTAQHADSTYKIFHSDFIQQSDYQVISGLMNRLRRRNAVVTDLITSSIIYLHTINHITQLSFISHYLYNQKHKITNRNRMKPPHTANWKLTKLTYIHKAAMGLQHETNGTSS